MSMDYFFMSQADENADKNPLIAMVDESTGEKYARAVGKKGIGEENEMEWLVKDMSEEMKSWGHQGGDGGHIILKSDGERSIVALRTALAKFHGGKVVPEDPPRGEIQSNGTVEEAGKTVRELVSRFLVGKDGLTAYERRRGRKCRIPVVAFGEKVWYKEIRPGKERANKLESEWREGLWLGHSRRSNEAVIGTREGVVRAYAVKRMDEESRWDAKYLQEMKGTPQQRDLSRPGLAIPIKVNIDPPHEESPAPAGACASRESCSRSTDTPRVATDVDTNAQECERHVHIPRYAVGGSRRR